MLVLVAILFAFTLHPGGSTGTLGMSLYVIPVGIGSFPAAQTVFAAAFFFLLVIAGLTSSISIIEGPVSAIRDKFGWSRKKVLLLMAGIGVVGSVVFSLPMMLEQGGTPKQTVGLSILELVDHWAFGYSLLIVGLAEAIFIGWVYGIDKLRAKINENARFKLGPGFDVLIKWVVPILIAGVLIFNVLVELGVAENSLGAKGFYKGDSGTFDGLEWMPFAVFGFWVVVGIGGAWLMTMNGSHGGAESGGEA